MTLAEVVHELERRHGIYPTIIAAVLGIDEATLIEWIDDESEVTEEDALLLDSMLRNGDVVECALAELREDLLTLAPQQATIVERG